jgi:predicted XRE-type DNA-binding protein
MAEHPELYEGSGNVFSDLALEGSEELYARAKIGFEVWNILKERKLKQSEIAEVLGIAQSNVSLLMNCKFNRFSTEKLLGFLKKLDPEVILMINLKNRQPIMDMLVSLEVSFNCIRTNDRHSMP